MNLTKFEYFLIFISFIELPVEKKERNNDLFAF